MIFIIGPYASGKREAAAKLLRCDMEALRTRCKWDVQELVVKRDDLETLADELCAYDAVIATETGMGVVPLDADERAAREKAGRLNQLLAARADAVVRVFCGIPVVLKGDVC